MPLPALSDERPSTGLLIWLRPAAAPRGGLRAASEGSARAGARVRGLTVVPLLAAVGATAVVYAPIAGNYFHADDFTNLQALVRQPFLPYVLEPGAGHIYVVRNVLFWLFYRTFGADPAWMFGAVLLTHLLNVGLLYGVIRHLTGSARLAFFGAALWGIAPAHEGSLGWYAVYGNVLVGTFALVLLMRVVRSLATDTTLGVGEALVWYVLLLLACVTFGVGIGVALVFPATVLLLFPGGRTTARVRLLFLSLPPVV